MKRLRAEYCLELFIEGVGLVCIDSERPTIALMDDMPSSSCFECFNKECNFIVLALVGSFIGPFRYTMHWMLVLLEFPTVVMSICP